MREDFQQSWASSWHTDFREEQEVEDMDSERSEVTEG